MGIRNIAMRALVGLLLVDGIASTSIVSTGGEERPEKRITKLLEARYRSAKTMQATFLERYSEDNRTVRVEAGIAYFRRPGKMRWEYESPEKNLFLVDGKNAWFYVPADHTVTRVPAKESGDLRTPLSLLAGEAKLSRICEQVRVSTTEPTENPKGVMLACLPKGQETPRTKSGVDAQQHEASDAIFLEVDRDSGELLRALVRGRGAVEVEFRFAQWRMDPPVSDSLFRFDVPAGVAIVNGPSSSTNGAAIQ